MPRTRPSQLAAIPPLDELPPDHHNDTRQIFRKKRENAEYHFHVRLDDIEPDIWRTFVVPGVYTFWDLHVAIQDVMGWFDYHLHDFRLNPTHAIDPVHVGIPENERLTLNECLTSWRVSIIDYFMQADDRATYLYDFGDRWRHTLTLREITPLTPGMAYPVCTGGERACPPEDTGGPDAYVDLLEILADPHNPDHADRKRWLKNHPCVKTPFKPEAFNPKKVSFDNPRKRLWPTLYHEAQYVPREHAAFLDGK